MVMARARSNEAEKEIRRFADATSEAAERALGRTFKSLYFFF